MTTIRSFRYVFVLLVAVMTFTRCSDQETPTPTLSAFQENAIDYFTEVALGFEYGDLSQITRKWEEPMKLFIGGDRSDDDMIAEVNKVVDAINAMSTDGFQIEIVSDTLASNAYIFLGSRWTFKQMFPDAAGDLIYNLAYFNAYFEGDVIERARIFVDTEYTTREEINSLIWEEIAQSIGLGRDSPKYPTSVFYETDTEIGNAAAFSPIDEEIVRLLYHPRVSTGLNAAQVRTLLSEILVAENAETLN